MDLLRGVAILLVVLFHTMTIASNKVVVPDGLVLVNAVMSPIRMPMLMVLSGLLLARSVAKGRRPYFRGKLTNIAWPYAVWTLLMAALLGATRGTTGNGFDLGMLLRSPAVPLEHLWFLQHLLLLYTLAWFVRSWSPVVTAAATFSLCLVAAALGWTRAEDFFYLGTFFFVGAAASADGGSLLRRLRGRPLAVVSLLSGSSLCAAMLLGTDRFFPALLPLTLLSVAGLVMLSARIPPGRATVALQFVGRNSLAFYVMHYPVQLVTAGALDRLVPGTAAVLLPSMVLTPLVCCTALVLLARVRGFGWLLRWPPRRTVTSGSQPVQPVQPAQPVQ